jgi:hypothetical protein
MATCEFRDECWAEVDERTLGAVISDKGAAKRAKVKHRIASAKRPHACGFELTTVWFCPKYRRWKSAAGQEPPVETTGTVKNVVDATMPAATETLPLDAIPDRELDRFVYGYEAAQAELEI